MQPHDLVEFFVCPLEQAAIDYIVTGSVAAMLYSEPRLTHDIDMIVHLQRDDAKRLAAIFPSSQYYCPPEEVILTEIRRSVRAQFNVIHHDSGFKADFYLLGNDPLHAWAFSNKKRLAINDDLSVYVAPPEYVVIRKMQYYSEGGSEKHLNDIKKLIAMVESAFDSHFVEQQVERLGLHQIWQKINKV